jgi:hypothetical protein
MADIPAASPIKHVTAPSLVPSELAEILHDADAYLTLLGCEPLDVVADLATSLTATANDAGAREIAEAAEAVRRIAAGRRPATLTGAMRNLSDALTRAQHELHIEA